MSESSGDYPLVAAEIVVDGAIETLTAYRRVLEEAQPSTAAERRRMVQVGGLLATTIVDELTRLYVGDGRTSDDLLDEAETVVNELGAEPAGFTTSIDAQYYERMKRATAIMLARLWSTGRLLGVVPVQAWPSAELARLLLPAVEEYADVISIDYELDQLDGDDDGGT